MYIASQKKKENIAEYILYMWQVEDLLRANGLDIDRLRKTLLDRFDSLDAASRRELEDWYESLADMMRREGKEKSGHLQININTLSQIDELHRLMLRSPKYPQYSAEYYKTLPFLVELRSRQGDNKLDEMETCFTALYAALMLRLQGRPISEGTQQALDQISRLLAMLARYWRLDAENRLFEPDEDPRNAVKP